MKRYVAFYGDEEALQVVQEAAAGHERVVVQHGHAEAMPLAGVIATPGHAAEALDAALSQTDQAWALLGMLADAVDCREGVPLGSTERLRDHAARLAEALELDEQARNNLEVGAMLHDVGKIRISNDVLLKKSVLTYDEWLLLQSHTKLGADLLHERGIADGIAEIVHRHHECWDGDGYPDHLEGEEIHLGARILKLVDVYCSMTSPRHYRKGHATHEEAIAHLEKERGKHFDPELVDVFLEHQLGETPRNEEE